MTLRFAFTRPDGGVTIVGASAKSDLEHVLGTLTDQAYEDHVRAKSIPADATDVVKLPDNWTPPDDRTFRDAWKHINGVFAIDLDKAKTIAASRGIDVKTDATLDDLRAALKA